MDEMKKYISVDVFGGCGNFHCRKGSPKCTATLAQYKFYLAFENSLCKDYVTKKLFQNIREELSLVPVVMGGADYSQIMPPGSYIDTRNFDSAK